MGENSSPADRSGGSRPARPGQAVLAAGLILLGAILLFALFKNNQVYKSYEVQEQFSRGGDVSVIYRVVDAGILGCGSNGVAMTGRDGSELWDQTYDMSSPVLACSGSYAAVGDRGGAGIYIFDAQGQCGSLTADEPLQDIRISEQGVAAAVLSDSSSSYINLYDKTGKLLVSIKATLGDTGYPQTLALSPDGTYLAVSYLDLSKGKVRTQLKFYNFSEGASEKEIYSETIDGICPRIEYLSGTKAAVFKEKGCSIYSMGDKASKDKEIDFEEDIRSIFTVSGRIGFIFSNSDEKGKYRIRTYDSSGSEGRSIYFDLDYMNVSAAGDNIVVYNDTRAQGFRFSGRQIFDGTFESGIISMMPGWDSGTYWVVDDNNMSLIKVK